MLLRFFYTDSLIEPYVVKRLMESDFIPAIGDCVIWGAEAFEVQSRRWHPESDVVVLHLSGAPAEDTRDARLAVLKATGWSHL